MTVSIVLSIIAAIIGIIVAPFTFLKIVIDIRASNKSILREEYKIAKEFFTDQGISLESQPIVLDRGYKALAGYKDLDASEIKYILGFKAPDKAFLAYSMGGQLLTYNESINRIVFKSKWLIHPRQRYYIQRLSISSYFVLAFIAIIPTIFHISNTVSFFTILNTHYLIFLPFLIPAFFGFWLSDEILSAEKFMKVQESQQRTQA